MAAPGVWSHCLTIEPDPLACARGSVGAICDCGGVAESFVGGDAGAPGFTRGFTSAPCGLGDLTQSAFLVPAMEMK